MVWMLAAIGSNLTHADRVKAVPVFTAPAFRNCELPLNKPPWPISPLVDTGATPDVAGCCSELSAYGKPLSLKCQTKSKSGHAAPFGATAGGLVAIGLPQ